MKRIWTLSLLVATATSLNAQTFKPQRKPLTGVEAYRKQMLLKANATPSTAQKPTTMQQRVIAEAGYEVNGPVLTKSDTTLFKYSGGRGSKFDYNELYHNYYFPGNGDPALDALDFGNINVKADTARYYSVTPTAGLQEEMTSSYTSTNKVLDYRFRTVSNNQRQRSVNNYDAQGRIDLMTGFEWNNTTQQWDSLTRRVVTYNAQNEVLSDTVFAYNFGEWTPYQAQSFTYNANHKPIAGLMKMDPALAGTFMDLYTIVLEYYPNNTLKALQVDVNQGMGLNPYQRDSFAYDPANMYQTFEQIWDYDVTAGDWVLSTRTLRNVNTAGLPDTTQFFSWNQTGDSFDLNGIVTTAYNSYSNPTLMQSYSDNGAGLDNVYRYFFYYEDFDPTAVSNIPGAEENMKVYPNPVYDRVSVNWKADGKQVNLSVINAAGQLMHSESINRVRENEQISVSNLSPGVYWLTVNAANGAVLYKTTLVKQ